MWLKTPVEERDAEGKRKMSGGKESTHGTPQGGVISPVAGEHLYASLSEGVEKTGEGGAVPSPSGELRRRLRHPEPRARERRPSEWTRQVITKIGLTLNEQKTSIRDGRRESFDFLGYTFGPMISKSPGDSTWGRHRPRRRSSACANGCGNPPSGQRSSLDRSEEGAQPDAVGLGELLQLRKLWAEPTRQ